MIVRWIVEHAPSSVYDTKTDPERFTFREAVAHLADWEPILQERMRQIKDQPGSIIVAYDEGKRAIDENYAAINPADAVEQWAKSRAESIEYFEKEAPGFWDSVARHPERGDISLYDLANMEVAHDTYHIEHLLGFLK